MRRISVLLITAAFIVGMVGCEPAATWQYNLTVSSTAGGLVTTPGEGPFTYAAGTVVDLVAEPDEWYRFVNWTGDVDTIDDVSSASTTIKVSGNYSVTASFALSEYTLTTSSTSGGSVTTPGEGTFTYQAGTEVNLVAEAQEGYRFISWTGNTNTVIDVTANTTSLTILRRYSIQAIFAKEVYDWYDLDAVRDNLSGHYVLMNDLDSTSAGYQEMASATANEGRGWEPIGRWDPYHYVAPGQPFSGTFDGQGYEIKELFIDRPDEDYVGLFGAVGLRGATQPWEAVRNVGLVSATVNGHWYVGGLVGRNYHPSTVSGSYSIATVAGSLSVGGLVGSGDGYVTTSHSAGVVTGNYSVGGLVGRCGHGGVTYSHSASNVTGLGVVGGLVGCTVYGSVSFCYSAGNVTGSIVGGLVGCNTAGVTESYFSGTVIGDTGGGLIGQNRGRVNNCYSTGSVTIGLGAAGGLVALNLGVVSNSFWDVETSGIGVSGGGTGKTTAEMTAIATFTDTSAEGLDSPWIITAVVPGETDDAYRWNIVDGQTYPFLSWKSVG